MAAEPEAISRFLEVLAEEHGSVRDYVVSIGVPNALLHPPRVGAAHHRSLTAPVAAARIDVGAPACIRATRRASSAHSMWACRPVGSVRRAAPAPPSGPVTYPAPIEQVMTPLDQALLRSRRHRLLQRARGASSSSAEPEASTSSTTAPRRSPRWWSSGPRAGRGPGSRVGGPAEHPRLRGGRPALPRWDGGRLRHHRGDLHAERPRGSRAGPADAGRAGWRRTGACCSSTTALAGRPVWPRS